MAIQIEEARTAGYPVVKAKRIGEIATMALIRFEQRNSLKRNPLTGKDEPVMKENGKYRQELVVHGIAMEPFTADAGLGDAVSIPKPGDRVRLILRSGGFGSWIEARKSHREGKINVGDVIIRKTDWAQAYDSGGSSKGQKIHDQAAADKLLLARTTVGFYGELTLAVNNDAAAVAEAEAAYNADLAITLPDQDDDVVCF